MQIVKLTTENIKRLHAVEITPDGNLIIVGGDNAAGKTSVLDSILYAIGGKKAVPDEPVHRGEDSAAVTLDLGDLIVERTFDADGKTSLRVKNADGGTQTKPQTILDNLTGRISFDPLAFLQQKASEQVETLAQLVGVNFKELDDQRRTFFDDRRLAGQEQRKAKAKLDEVPFDPDAPDKELNIAKMAQALEDANAHNAKVQRNKDAAESFNQRMQDAEEHLRLAQVRVDELNAERENREATAGELDFISTDELKAKFAVAETTNKAVVTNRRHNELADELTEAGDTYGKLTREIATIDALKGRRVTEATFPIEGLTFGFAEQADDDQPGQMQVRYNDLPFEQASSAERLRVSVAIGMAMNPDLRVVLIRDGSLLDEKNLQMIADMAEEGNYQVWLERVGEGEECAVIIEDGRVKATA